LHDRRSNGQALAGIIYMLDVSQRRLDVASFQSLEKLRTSYAVDNIILVTTSKDKTEQRHEAALKKYWETIVGQASRMCRFDSTYESAWTIINLFVPNVPIDV
jgi:hypothetical protein